MGVGELQIDKNRQPASPMSHTHPLIMMTETNSQASQQTGLISEEEEEVMLPGVLAPEADSHLFLAVGAVDSELEVARRHEAGSEEEVVVDQLQLRRRHLKLDLACYCIVVLLCCRLP